MKINSKNSKAITLTSILFLVFFVALYFFRDPLGIQMPIYLIVVFFLVLAAFLFERNIEKIIKEELDLDYPRIFLFGYRAILAYLLYKTLPTPNFSNPTYPISFLRTFEGLQPLVKDAAFMGALESIFVISLPLFVFRLLPRFSTLAATLIFVLFETVRYSYGKLGHGSHLLSLIMFSFVIYYWFFDYKKKNTHNVPIVFSLFIVSIYYFLSFFAKIYWSGIDWINRDSLRLWIALKQIDFESYMGRSGANFPQQAILRTPFLALFLSAFTLVSELLGGLVIFIRRFRPVVLVFLISLHIGISYTMGIVFHQNIIILTYLLLGSILATKRGGQKVSG